MIDVYILALASLSNAASKPGKPHQFWVSGDMIFTPVDASIGPIVPPTHDAIVAGVYTHDS